MSVFDDTKEILDNLFSVNGDVWVKRKNISEENIETYNGVAVDDERTHTCFLCVALNDTIFKNNNKPEYYHPHCKCKNVKTELKDVVLDFPLKKITEYLFVENNKKNMMKSMGFDMGNSNEIYNFVANSVKTQFMKGNYILKKLDANGQRFTINTVLHGNNGHVGSCYICHIGCVAWPNGKIKITTPLILDKEII